MRSVARTLGWLSAVSLLLTACYGAYQIKPDDPRSVSGLTPNVEDKDAASSRSRRASTSRPIA
jgi:hypothetical protein